MPRAQHQHSISTVSAQHHHSAITASFDASSPFCCPDTSLRCFHPVARSRQARAPQGKCTHTSKSNPVAPTTCFHIAPLHQLHISTLPRCPVACSFLMLRRERHARGTRDSIPSSPVLLDVVSDSPRPPRSLSLPLPLPYVCSAQHNDADGLDVDQDEPLIQ